MSASQVAGLWSSFRETPVLSLYLPLGDGVTTQRGSWRLRVNALLKDLEEEVIARDVNGRESFRSARALVIHALEEPMSLPLTGTWVLFATSQRVFFSRVVSEWLTPLARFEPGPRIAPLIGLSEVRQRGVVVLVDAWRARLFEVEGATLTEIVDLIGDPPLGGGPPDSASKRASTATGTRGQSGKDQAERAWATEMRRFVLQVKSAALDLDGGSGFIVIGGALRMTKALAAEVDAALSVLEVPGLTVGISQAELERAIRGPLLDLHRSRGAATLGRVEDNVGNDGRGCLGWNDTLRSLRGASVQTLVVAEGLIAEDPDRAEEMIRLALERGGSVEVVSEESGKRLHEVHGGVAALRRYPVSEAAESVAS